MILDGSIKIFERNMAALVIYVFTLILCSCNSGDNLIDGNWTILQVEGVAENIFNNGKPFYKDGADFIVIPEANQVWLNFDGENFTVDYRVDRSAKIMTFSNSSRN